MGSHGRRYRALLVNPPVYDFAAYNLWAKPFGLLKVAELISGYGFDVSLIDCMEAYLPKRYGTGKYIFTVVDKPQVLRDFPGLYKRYGMPEKEFLERVRACGPVDLVLVTSQMTYWYPGVGEAIETVRKALRRVPIILGGFYATIYPDHAKTLGADFVWRGEVGEDFIEFLKGLGFKPRRTEGKRYWEFGRRWPFGIIMTSKGCPFRCPYCATPLLRGDFEGRPLREVLDELLAYRELRVKDIAFYDDALLVNPERHIKPLLREVARMDLGFRFHTPNGLHPRFIDGELARLFEACGFETLRLSYESVNPERQSGKVTTEDLRRAIEELEHAGFPRRRIGVYLMYGLPGQPIDEVWQGVRFLMELGVRIHLAEFSPIRGTPYWQKLVREKKIPDDMDPLLTNNSVFSFLFWEEGERIRELKLRVRRYNQGL